MKFIGLQTTNVIEHLLYADGNNLSLLKAVAMNYITHNGSAVMQSDSFPMLRESPILTAEVMKTCFERIDVLEGSTKRKRGDSI